MGMNVRLLAAGLAALLLAGCGGSGNPLIPQLRPVMGGAITSGFGLRENHPIRGYVPGLHHDGYDFAVASGSPVRAAMSGTVSFAGWRGGYGNAVVLTHEGGYTTLYGHASELKVQEGQHVSQGDVIALVGSTGLSTGPHLHYELRKDGVAIDPGAFIDDPTPVERDAAVERPMSPEVAIQREPEAKPAAAPAVRKLAPAPTMQLPHHTTSAIELEAQAVQPGRSWE
jgi:murein DD-endopeptidase MepM/ murein hydrolase activator NlpD